MAELKTKKNNVSVEKFLAGIPDEQQRQDAYQLVKIMKQISQGV